MSLSASLLLFKGDHRAAMPEVFRLFRCRPIDSPQTVQAWSDVVPILSRWRVSRALVKKAVTSVHGWTVVLDPEMVMAMDRKACGQTSERLASAVLGVLIEGV